MMRIATAAIAASLVLAGCGSKSDTELASGTITDPDTGETTDYSVTTDGDEGNLSIKTEDGEMQFGSGAANAKLPAGFAPYPGSKMTGGFTATGKDGQGGMASFEAPGKAEDVIAHFRRQAEAAGLKVNAEVKSGDTLMLGAEKPDDSKSGVQITATQDGDMVKGSVTYGMGG